MTAIPVGTSTADPRRAAGRPAAIVDCDVHPWPGANHLAAFLPARWRRYLEQFGARGPFPGLVGIRPFAARMDAWPEGDVPGGDADFARKQLLDLYDIDYAILNATNALFPTHFGGNQPRAFSDALLRATNEWMAEKWLGPDKRWLGSISTPFDDDRAAAAEIHRCRESSGQWAQVLLPIRMTSPLGNPRYHKVIEAAVDHGLPIALHVSSGFPAASYFYESHVSHPLSAYGHIASLIFEGTFDRYPELKIAMLEANWSWLAPYAWRLDRIWTTLRDEVPDLRRKPSEYIAEHLYVTTQPAEEPEHKPWFREIYEQFSGLFPENRLMFSTDYPHWDFDSPTEALPSQLPAETLEDIMWRTADRLYGLGLGGSGAPERNT
ncbi:amidohydrolase family protein [Streptomyces sp. cg40]|uniref:amidohydrolase family protein n=1 Tax=Streptomyces sp. cg40 TaxID=3419764 RepID=UPI003CFD5E02